MRTADIIERIRAECPSFAFIGHALASVEAMSYPAALVSPVKAISAPNDSLEVIIQRVVERFGVFIILSRRQDGSTDYGAADELDDLRIELRTALINYSPDPAEFAPLSYAGGELAPYAPGASTWREDFVTEHHLRVST